MSFAKRMIEKDYALYSSAVSFLIEYHFVEEALDGTLCAKIYSDNCDVYKCAANYYKKKDFLSVFSLVEFKDEIKHILDTCEFSSAFDYDFKRLD